MTGRNPPTVATATTAPPTGLRLLVYVLLPRPQELLVKTSFVLVAYLTGRWASMGPGLAVWEVAMAIVALELLAYQARYQVNDILDAFHDADHPAAASRRRIPGGESGRVRATVFGAAAGRVALAGATCLFLQERARLTSLIGIGCIFLVALVYESLRRVLRRPVSLLAVSQLDWVCAATFVVVGAGYGLRVATGLALAGAPAWALVPAAAFGWLLGIACVSMTWALEGTAFITAGWSGIDEHLLRKRHLAVSLRFAGMFPPDPAAGSGSPVLVRVLARPSQLRSPWAIAALAASTVAAVLGLLLGAQWRTGSGALPGATGATVAVITAVAVAGGAAELALRLPSPSVSVAVGCLFAVAAAFGGIGVVTDLPRPALAGLPAFLLLGAVFVFRGFSYSALAGFGSRSSSRSTDTPSNGES